MYKIFNDLKKIIVNNYKFIIFVFLISFLSNATNIINEYAANDAVYADLYFHSGVWEFSLGRWGNLFFDLMHYSITLPFLYSILSLLVYPLIPLIFCELFEIKNGIKYLIGAYFACFPAFFETLLYTYCSLNYVVSLLLVVFASYIILKEERNILNDLIIVICIVFSFSIYQANIGVLVFLIAMYYSYNYLKYNIQFDFKNIIRVIGLCVCSAIIYIIITFAILKLFKTNLNIGNYAGDSGFNLVGNISNIYYSFYAFFTNDEIINNTYYYRYLINGLIFIFSIAIIIIKIIKEKKGWLLVILFISPLMLHVLSIIMSENIRLLTAMPYVFVIPLLIKYLSDFMDKRIVITLGVLLVISYVTLDNAMARKIDLDNIKTENVVRDLYTRFTQIDSFDSDTRVAFIGNVNDIGNKETIRMNKFEEAVYSKRMNVSNSGRFYGDDESNVSMWRYNFQKYTGIVFDTLYYSDALKITESEEFQNMDVYPGKNSVQVINGAIIVKFKE